MLDFTTTNQAVATSISALTISQPMDTSNETVGPTTKPVVDPVTFEIFMVFLHFLAIALSFLCVTGIFNNVVNIATFLKMGLEDSVTTSFFALAISDLNICAIGLGGSVGTVMQILEVGGKISPYVTATIPIFFLAAVQKGFAATTILITTYLAVQRCLCVLMPFKVKWMFTRMKTCCYIVVAFVFPFISYIVYIDTFELIEYKIMNTSRLVFKETFSTTHEYFVLTDIVLALCLNVGCQVVVVLCLIIMFVVLGKAAQFRKSAVTTTVKKSTAQAKTPTAGDTDTSGYKIKSKETQALKQVALISAIFVVTNTPYMVEGLAQFFIPDYGLHATYLRLSYIMSSTVHIIQVVNSSVNFFVYYNFNTKFQKYCIIRSR